MKKLFTLACLVAVAAMILSACGTPTTAAPQATVAPVKTEAPVGTAVSAYPSDPTTPDLLSTILARGTMVVSTDPAYPPQSSLKADPQRTPDTKCTSEQKTIGELEGFDIDVAAAIAKSLGVEVCFTTPDWGLIVAGNWAGRWDISIGSVTITPERAEVLYFAQPYYTTPAALFVNTDNTTFTKPADLDGKKVGVCAGCTYESYLNSTLVIPGVTMDYLITGADVKTYDTDSTALEDLALGDGVRLDAVLTAQPTGAEAVKNGKSIKQLGDPIYFEFLAPAFDRFSELDPMSFIEKVSGILGGMQTDGSLLALSTKYYGIDLTSAAAKFDLNLLGQ